RVGDGSQQQVARAEIAVDQASSVDGADGLSQGSGHSKDIGCAGAPPGTPQVLHTLLQRPSVRMVQNQVGLLPVGFAQIVDGDDVATADLAQATPFPDESFPNLGIEAVVLGENLDHHRVLHQLIVGAVHRRKPTDTDDVATEVAAHVLVHGYPIVAVTMACISAPCDFTVPVLSLRRSAIWT